MPKWTVIIPILGTASFDVETSADDKAAAKTKGWALLYSGAEPYHLEWEYTTGEHQLTVEVVRCKEPNDDS